MHFAVEAMRPDGTTLSNVVEAPDRGSAVESLRDKGLVVLRVDPHAESGPRSAGLQLRRAKITLRDLVLLTRQMKMLLESGAPLVPALEAAHEQTTKPAMRALLARLRERVEEGESLSEALVPESQHFDAVFRSMVAAGESTATLPDVFGRLGALTQRQMQTRKLVVGALLYPAVLSGLLVTVLGILLFFVVPRFKLLFNTLRTPLPATTKFLFAASEYVVTGWPYLLAAGVAASVALVLALRRPAARIWLDRLVVGLPVVGRLLSRLILARVVRVWAAMLRCHVPLLETIRQSREAVTNAAFLHMVSEIEEVVASGGRIGQALGQCRLADPVIVSAIRTGEENGRLAEAADFVSTWLDEDNAGAVQQITRLAEPLLLAFMGLVVGVIAMSLFVPLFDLASAAG